MKKKILYVGLDVHKKYIDVVITDVRANGKVRSYGKIDGTLEALDKQIYFSCYSKRKAMGKAPIALVSQAVLHLDLLGSARLAFWQKI